MLYICYTYNILLGKSIVKDTIYIYVIYITFIYNILIIKGL
jgi:hypothetical protein